MRGLVLEVPVECGVVTGALMTFIGTLNAPIGPFVALLLVNIEPPKVGKAGRARNGVQKRIWAGLDREDSLSGDQNVPRVAKQSERGFRVLKRIADVA